MLRSAALVLALALAAPASLALAQPAGPGSPPAPPAPTLTQSDVELIEPGEGTRRPLRHQFAPGQRARYRLRIDADLSISAGPRNQAVDMPVLVLDVDVGPSTMHQGNVRLPFRMTAADVEGGAEQARGPAMEQLRGLVGTSGRAEVDPRGRVIAFDYELPDSASPETRARASTVRDALGQIMPRFPSEPVAPGAQWRIRDTMSMPGMEVQIATVYRLRRWDGDRIELQVRVESGREPATQAMQMTVEGSGRTRFVLGTLQTRSRLRSQAEVRARGPNGEMRIQMSSRNEVEPLR